MLGFEHPHQLGTFCVEFLWSFCLSEYTFIVLPLFTFLSSVIWQSLKLNTTHDEISYCRALQILPWPPPNEYLYQVVLWCTYIFPYFSPQDQHTYVQQYTHQPELPITPSNPSSQGMFSLLMWPSTTVPVFFVAPWENELLTFYLV